MGHRGDHVPVNTHTNRLTDSSALGGGQGRAGRAWSCGAGRGRGPFKSPVPRAAAGWGALPALHLPRRGAGPPGARRAAPAPSNSSFRGGSAPRPAAAQWAPRSPSPGAPGCQGRADWRAGPAPRGSAAAAAAAAPERERGAAARGAARGAELGTARRGRPHRPPPWPRPARGPPRRRRRCSPSYCSCCSPAAAALWRVSTGRAGVPSRRTGARATAHTDALSRVSPAHRASSVSAAGSARFGSTRRAADARLSPRGARRRSAPQPRCQLSAALSRFQSQRPVEPSPARPRRGRWQAAAPRWMIGSRSEAFRHDREGWKINISFSGSSRRARTGGAAGGVSVCRVRLRPFPGKARRARCLNPRGSSVGPPGRVATRVASIPERGCAPPLARPRGRGRERGEEGNPAALRWSWG